MCEIRVQSNEKPSISLNYYHYHYIDVNSFNNNKLIIFTNFNAKYIHGQRTGGTNKKLLELYFVLEIRFTPLESRVFKKNII